MLLYYASLISARLLYGVRILKVRSTNSYGKRCWFQDFYDTRFWKIECS